MKYLLVLIVVMVGIWVWRANRSGERAERRAEAAQRARDRGGRAQVAVDIVGCDWCGLHFPRGDAIDGRKGVYCCVQHRDQAEA